MYIINIRVNLEITTEQQEKLFSLHVSWFQKYFETGKFVVIGPYLDRERAGVIIAHTVNRAELDTILCEDSYWPNLAEYDIREFLPKMIATDLSGFQVE